VIDMKAITEAERAALGTEEEAFEGEVPIANVEKKVAALINGGKV